VSVEWVALGGEVTPTILDTAEDLGVDGTALDVLLSAGRPVTLTG